MVKTDVTTVDSKTAIFEAAAREIAESSYEAARVDSIAKKAGVNKAMIYYHFQSKLGLHLAILRDMFGAVGARVKPIAEGGGGAAVKLDAWIETIVEEASARPWFPPIMLREVASGGERLDPDTLAAMQDVYGALRKIIAQGQRDGVFRAVDPLLAQLTILPPILVFLARERLVARQDASVELLEPRRLDAFVTHLQDAARRMLRKNT